MVDELIKSSLATVQMGVAKADGKLSLTTTALSFVPFNAQLGLGPYHFQRDTIISVEQAVGKGGGILPLTTDAIRITLSDASTYEFIIAMPAQWLAAFGKLAS